MHMDMTIVYVCSADICDTKVRCPDFRYFYIPKMVFEAEKWLASLH